MLIPSSMKSRRFPSLRRCVAIGALTLSAFAGGALTSRLSQARIEDPSPYGLLAQLSRVLVLIENEYVDPVDRERLLSGAGQCLVLRRRRWWRSRASSIRRSTSWG